MLQEPERVCLIRRNLSRKRMFRFGVDRDDRGWTPLHIGARKGDLKQVSHLSFFFPLLLQLLYLIFKLLEDIMDFRIC